MLDLPEPKPTAPAAGQAHLNDQAQQLVAAVEEAMRTPTSYRDDTPVPAIGSAPPVDQPGRPSMSPRATDASVMMIAGGFLSLCLGAAVSAVLYFSGTANETVVICLCAGPPAGFLALKSLVKGVKQAAPAEIHNHYTGTVHQQNSETHTSTRGVWARTNNQQK
ncbi:hypothetical protein O3Q52_20055 [Streptomyces sp. ActVer]|uniref:hypothetical protein n=1 Tax=Streptomyces sp. ActVer TaxID=3014558 RepID=UPI0022B55614|nr:hypothetical protein [Streptomyces sp. ActVer]MCZ4510441.1 hypothetical protein [Streptomyces sp. ActVer]